MVAPETNKMMVFNKGILQGLNTSIPTGGQELPNNILGTSAE